MKSGRADALKQGINNINSLYDKLSNTIAMTTNSWNKAVIGNNFDVIVKETESDWEAVATNLIIEKSLKNRLVMLDVIEQNGKKYMVLTYPARMEKAKMLLQKRVNDYKKGTSPFVFGTDEELEIAKERLLRTKLNVR